MRIGALSENYPGTEIGSKVSNDRNSWRVNAKRVAGSAGIYSYSVGVLMLAEILIIRNFGEAVYGGYRIVIVAAPVLVLVGFAGYESAVSRAVAERREPVAFDRYTHIRVLRTFGLALGFSVILVYWLGIGYFTAVSLVGLVVGLSVSLYVAAQQRALDRPGLAALSQQGYRAVGGTLIILLMGTSASFEPTMIFAGAALVIAVMSALWLVNQDKFWVPAKSQRRWLVGFGHGFAWSGASMAAIDLLDQVLVASLAGVEVAGVYASLKLMLVFPVMSISSILSFIALPTAVRYVRLITITRLHRALVGSFVTSFVVAVILAVSGAILYPIVLGTTLRFSEIVVFGCIGWMRLYYVIPSSMLGALSHRREMSWLGGSGILGVAVLLATSLVVYFIDNADVVMSIGTAVLFAFAVRNVFAISLCYLAARRRIEYDSR